MKAIMAVAAFALAIGNAQARLRWTMGDCENVWGAPVDVRYNGKIDQTCYTFVSSKKLAVIVYLLNGQVQSVNYCSRDARFLVNNVRQLLQKNCSGAWNLYDDGRGKQTYATWNYKNSDGEMIAYALLYNNPNAGGWYRMQVSTSLWDAYLADHNARGFSPDTNGLNV